MDWNAECADPQKVRQLPLAIKSRTAYILNGYERNNLCASCLCFMNKRTIVIYMLSKNSLGLLKKGVAKQSRIKRIIRHLKWLASTKADISLRPSGLVRAKTDIKLRLQCKHIGKNRD